MTGADRFSTTRESMTMKRIGIAPGVGLGRQARGAPGGRRRHGRPRGRLGAGHGGRGAHADGAGLPGCLLRRRDAALTTLSEHHAHEELEAAQGAPVVHGRQQPGGAGHDQRARDRARTSPPRCGSSRAPHGSRWSDGWACRPTTLRPRRRSPTAGEALFVAQPPDGAGRATRHRGRAARRGRRNGQPRSQLVLGSLVWPTHRLLRPGDVRRQHPAAGFARRAPGPRNRRQAGLGRQGRGQPGGGHAQRHRRIPRAGQRRAAPGRTRAALPSRPSSCRRSSAPRPRWPAIARTR